MSCELSPFLLTWQTGAPVRVGGDRGKVQRSRFKMEEPWQHFFFSSFLGVVQELPSLIRGERELDVAFWRNRAQRLGFWHHGLLVNGGWMPVSLRGKFWS